jgi:hypothetical protein
MRQSDPSNESGEQKARREAVEMYDATAPPAREIAVQWSNDLGFESTLARGYLAIEAERDALREALRERLIAEAKRAGSRNPEAWAATKLVDLERHP